jgi:hypothetical protein
MSNITYYVSIAFERDEAGELVAMEAVKRNGERCSQPRPIARGNEIWSDGLLENWGSGSWRISRRGHAVQRWGDT